MLVLSRKREERILIGDDIEVKVIAVLGNRVRLGITCPADVRILRSELVYSVDLVQLPSPSRELVTE
jgi:carbon storage regulator